MPIQIKIKSSGADISEYGPDPGKPEKQEENTDQSEKENKDKSLEESKDNKPAGSDTDTVKVDSCDEKNTKETSAEKDISKESEQSQVAGPAESSLGDVQYEYEGDEVFYTDQQTKVRYKWDKEKNSWVSEDGETTVPASTQPTSDQYQFDGETYVYRDEKGVKHRWNTSSNKWEEQEESEESEEDDATTDEQRKARQYRKRKAAPGWETKKYEKDPVTGKTIYKDPLDGMTYEFDEEKKAWFPQIGEDFMAAYQLNYGFTNDLESKPTVPDPVKEEPVPEPQPVKQKKKKEVKAAEWFEEDESKSTKVYVSGLPTSVTEQEFEELMSKCGMVEHDIRTKKSKLKLYRDETGTPKGDGLCWYIKPESVQLALTILDGSEFKGNRISVERAKFTLKGNYDPKMKPKKLSKKEKEKAAKHKEKLFAWIPDKMKGERAKHEKVIVIKNLFDPAEFSTDPGLIIDYTSRIRAQCSKFGTCTKIVLYDKHEEGLCQIFFKDPSEADMAVQMLNGRLFGKRIMTAETWDGRTKYKKGETKEEEQERLSNWEKFLECEDEEEASKSDTSQTNPPKSEASETNSATQSEPMET